MFVQIFCRADLQERHRRHYGWCRGCHGWRTFCGPGELAAEVRKFVENSLQARTTTWIHRNQGGHLPALLAPGDCYWKPFPLQTIWPHQQTVLMFCWCFSVFKCCNIISTCGNLVPPFSSADPLRCSVVLLQIFLVFRLYFLVSDFLGAGRCAPGNRQCAKFLSYSPAASSKFSLENRLIEWSRE